MTPRRPRNPPTIWATLTITWAPLPNPPPNTEPYEQTTRTKLTSRGGAQWHTYETENGLLITHNIDLLNERATTNAYADPPSIAYEPLTLLAPAVSPVADWRPYTINPTPLATPPDATAATITLTQTNPELNLPPPIIASLQPTGRYSGLVIENRHTGTTARTQAIHRKTDSPAQLQRQDRYATACEFWRTLNATERRAWTKAADARAHGLCGFNFFLSLDMVVRKSVYGAFLACNKFPKCRCIEKLENNGFPKKDAKPGVNAPPSIDAKPVSETKPKLDSKRASKKQPIKKQ